MIIKLANAYVQKDATGKSHKHAPPMPCASGVFMQP